MSCGRSFLVSRYHNATSRQCAPFLRFSSATDGHLQNLRVALIGRPNVGKSTLFNRLTGRNSAIVSPVAGTTRDRREGVGYLSGLSFDLIDTGGLDNRGAISNEVNKQIEMALKSAHVALFLIDAKVGVTPVDSQYIKWLRKIFLDTYVTPIPNSGSSMPRQQTRSTENEYNLRYPKDLVVLANKTEGSSFYNASGGLLDSMSDIYSWGLGEPVAISAAHGDGMVDLFHVLHDIASKRGLKCLEESRKERRLAVKEMKAKAAEDAASKGITELNHSKADAISVEERVIQMAIMGKPNVGKSTLLNAICREERVIAGATEGLTRDAVSVEWLFKDRKFRLVDTAGTSIVICHSLFSLPNFLRTSIYICISCDIIW